MAKTLGVPIDRLRAKRPDCDAFAACIAGAS
jgi:hypothetical protein